MKRSRTPPAVATDAEGAAAGDGNSTDELVAQLAALDAKRAAIKAGESEEYLAHKAQLVEVQDAEISQSNKYAAERARNVEKLREFEVQQATQACDSQLLKHKKELLATVDEERKRVKQLIESGASAADDDSRSRVTTRKLRSKVKVDDDDDEGDRKKLRKTKDPLNDPPPFPLEQTLKPGLIESDLKEMMSEWKKDAAKFDGLTSGIVEVIAERDSLMYESATYGVGSEIVVTTDNNSKEMHCGIIAITSHELKVREAGEKTVTKIPVRQLRNSRVRMRPDRSRSKQGRR